MDQKAPAYAYIATSQDIGRSYADVSQSLLDMEWIAKYGVDDLVWFEGYPDRAQAEARADELSTMSEEQRRSLFLRHNPDQLDLTPRIWGSDPEQG